MFNNVTVEYLYIFCDGFLFKFKFKLYLKGQSNEIFDLQFFSKFEPACATDQRVKIFSILFKNSLSYSNFKSIPRRVSLPGVSYPCKSISPGYHTPASQ